MTRPPQLLFKLAALAVCFLLGWTTMGLCTMRGPDTVRILEIDAPPGPTTKDCTPDAGQRSAAYPEDRYSPTESTRAVRGAAPRLAAERQLLRAQLDLWEGRPRNWEDAELPDTWQPLAFQAGVEDLRRRNEAWVDVNVDCESAPCVAAVRLAAGHGGTVGVVQTLLIPMDDAFESSFKAGSRIPGADGSTTVPLWPTELCVGDLWKRSCRHRADVLAAALSDQAHRTP